jgi:peptide deformylase
MAVLPVRRLPDLLLNTLSRPIHRISPSIQRLIQDLIDTMRHHPRCVGLAAPQVGQSVRIAVVDITGHPKASKANGLIILVNPRITAREGSAVQREGCLSVPDLTGNVNRSIRVQVEALDASGRHWERWVEGFEAVAIQHEVDHLDGTLFLDRVTNLRTDVFQRKRYA